MTIEATATALVQDEALPAQVIETPEYNEDDALDAIFDKMGDDDEAEGPEAEPAKEEVEAAEPVEDEPEAAPEVQIEAPSELPLAIKKNWDAIPQEARDAFLETQRESNRKLGDQGRLMQGLAPIQDVLSDAARDIPGLADMRPQEIAREVMTLAKISGDFNTRPAETILSLVEKHGLGQVMAQHFTGQAVTPDAQKTAGLVDHIRKLEAQISKIADPEYLSSQFDAFSTQQQASNTVLEFTQGPDVKDTWAEVEPHMPAAIQFVQASNPQGLSETDTLTRAHQLVLGQIKPEALKAKTAENAAPKAAPVVDPEHSRKAQKAKSVNVNGSNASGKPKAMTEDEILDGIWAKNQS